MNEKMIERFQEVRYHVHGAACGPHRETGLAAATRRFVSLLAADEDKVAAPWVTRAGPEHLSDEEAEHFERLRLSPRLFMGVYPCGIVYADRGVNEGGDYARVAFLPFATLEIEWKRPTSPLRELVVRAAAELQAQRGELFATSATAARGADGRLLGCGQTVRLGVA